MWRGRPKLYSYHFSYHNLCLVALHYMKKSFLEIVANSNTKADRVVFQILQIFIKKLLRKICYTVKKDYRFSRLQQGCHKPNSHRPGIIKVFPARKSLVSDILAGDRKIVNLFYSVNSKVKSYYMHIKLFDGPLPWLYLIDNILSRTI
jgi:hypothetical protein